MRDIAGKAGVSVMTVSLALRGSTRVSPAMRTRIQDIAATLGYRPNPYVSVLMSSLHTTRHRRPGAAATLAFVASRSRAALSSWTFLNAVYDGVCRRARQLGYGVDTFYRSELGPRAAHLDRMLKARGIRGVIVGPTDGTTATLDYCLDWPHYALATIGFSLREPNLHRSTSYTYRSVRLAYRELWQRGYRRIGLVNTPKMHYRIDGNWSAGIYEAQLDYFGRVVPPAILLSEDRNEFLQWVRRFRPDAILCDGTTERGWLDAAGYRVPEAIGVATLSLLKSGEIPHYAGIDQRENAVGAAAVDIIVEQLNTNTFGLPTVAKTVMVDCAWRDGPSVRPLPSPAAARPATRFAAKVPRGRREV